jgi:hypothetical protein
MSADGSTVGEHVGPEIGASDSAVRSPLNKRPPLGVEKNPAVDPVRDDLLASCGPSSFAQALSQSALAPGEFDSSLQSSNVRFLHKHPKYTNGFVPVNNGVCVTPHKDACTVLDMPTLKSKRLPVREKDSSKRIAKPGPDGHTLGQRVAMAMAYATGRRGAEFTEADLLREVNALAPEGTEILSQQTLNAIRGSKVSRSSFSHLIAKCCGVNPDWLAFGIGKMTG